LSTHKNADERNLTAVIWGDTEARRVPYNSDPEKSDDLVAKAKNIKLSY
jgi:hypothetical protein